jgi:hypothetical protein
MIIPLEKRKRIEAIGDRGEDNIVRIIYYSRQGQAMAARHCGKVFRDKKESNETFRTKVIQHVREIQGSQNG